MKNDPLEICIALECHICRSKRSCSKKVTIYSEKVGHFICSQCGYGTNSLLFRFYETSTSFFLERRFPEDQEYTPLGHLYTGDTLHFSVSSPKGILYFEFSRS